MISPTARDIDRKVVSIHGPNATGRIAGFDDRVVSVAFGGGPISMARHELVWFSGKDRA